jgi:hypothetical protein
MITANRKNFYRYLYGTNKTLFWAGLADISLFVLLCVNNSNLSIFKKNSSFPGKKLRCDLAFFLAYAACGCPAVAGYPAGLDMVAKREEGEGSARCAYCSTTYPSSAKPGSSFFPIIFSPVATF